jgi:hypothetical protein
MYPCFACLYPLTMPDDRPMTDLRIIFLGDLFFCRLLSTQHRPIIKDPIDFNSNAHSVFIENRTLNMKELGISRSWRVLLAAASSLVWLTTSDPAAAFIVVSRRASIPTTQQSPYRMKHSRSKSNLNDADQEQLGDSPEDLQRELDSLTMDKEPKMIGGVYDPEAFDQSQIPIPMFTAIVIFLGSMSLTGYMFWMGINGY